MVGLPEYYVQRVVQTAHDVCEVKQRVWSGRFEVPWITTPCSGCPRSLAQEFQNIFMAKLGLEELENQEPLLLRGL